MLWWGGGGGGFVRRGKGLGWVEKQWDENGSSLDFLFCWAKAIAKVLEAAFPQLQLAGLFVF